MSDDKQKTKNEKEFYNPFNPLPEDGTEHEWRYKIVPTSKMHVREVCDVMAKRRGISDSQRTQYADQAGYDVAAFEEIGEKLVPQYEIHDVFSEYHVHAALAEAVFAGFPKLLKVTESEDGWEVEIVNQELFDRLDEGVVNEAFLSFSNNRSGIQQSLKSFSRK